MAVNPPRKCKGMLKAFPKARKHSYLCVEKSRFRPTRRNRVEGPFAGCPSHTAWPRDWASSNMPFGIRRFSNMNEGCYLISSREDSLLRRKKSSGYALCMVFVTDILQAPAPTPAAFLASAMGIPSLISAANRRFGFFHPRHTSFRRCLRIWQSSLSYTDLRRSSWK